MSPFHRARRRPWTAPATPAPAPTSAELTAWVAAADDLRDAAATAAGRFVVSLLGESIARGRPTRWFGHAPDRARARAVLATYDEPVDLGPLLDLETPMRAAPLHAAPDLAAAWRRRLEDDAAAARDEGRLGSRDAWHQEAEEVWTRSAGVVHRATGLHPAVALGQVRWVPGNNPSRPPGYHDELGLAATMRSVSEFQYTEAEWQACLAAEPLAAPPDGAGPDPTAWTVSCVAWAAAARPWQRAGA